MLSNATARRFYSKLCLVVTKNDQEEYLSCYDRKSGQQLWATKTGPAWKEMEPDWHSSRSTPTVGWGYGVGGCARGDVGRL